MLNPLELNALSEEQSSVKIGHLMFLSVTCNESTDYLKHWFARNVYTSFFYGLFFSKILYPKYTSNVFLSLRISHDPRAKKILDAY